jgi:hypothetical protein
MAKTPEQERREAAISLGMAGTGLLVASRAVPYLTGAKHTGAVILNAQAVLTSIPWAAAGALAAIGWCMWELTKRVPRKVVGCHEAEDGVMVDTDWPDVPPQAGVLEDGPAASL